MERYTEPLAVVSVRLPLDLYEAVVATAKAEDRSMAAVIRLALVKYIGTNLTAQALASSVRGRPRS
jgi:hypothetical protein